MNFFIFYLFLIERDMDYKFVFTAKIRFGLLDGDNMRYDTRASAPTGLWIRAIWSKTSFQRYTRDNGVNAPKSCRVLALTADM